MNFAQIFAFPTFHSLFNCFLFFSNFFERNASHTQFLQVSPLSCGVSTQLQNRSNVMTQRVIFHSFIVDFFLFRQTFQIFLSDMFHIFALIVFSLIDPINNLINCNILPVLTTKPIIFHAQISKHIPLIGV
jgi:hypothetical protein